MTSIFVGDFDEVMSLVIMLDVHDHCCERSNDLWSIRLVNGTTIDGTAVSRRRWRDTIGLLGVTQRRAVTV